MSDDGEGWEFPKGVQPKPEAVGFELDRVLTSVLSLRSEIPDDAFSAATLGRERAGNGVVIGADGLVLTIGYLITEAASVWLVSAEGAATPAHVVGYDQVTGFGLVQALGRLGVPAIELGSSAGAGVGEEVIVAGEGGRAHALTARIVSKREFAGYWEYLLDEAIFTAPPHPSWGGAAMIGGDGALLAIGSLLVQEAAGPGQAPGQARDGNMFVPIDLLPPILDDLMRFGKVDRPPRPWLGLFATEAEGALMVAGVASGAPAAHADLRVGDLLLKVDGAPIADLAEMFRRIWSLGVAGTLIPLTISRDGAEFTVAVQSADRNAFLKSPGLH